MLCSSVLDFLESRSSSRAGSLQLGKWKNEFIENKTKKTLSTRTVQLLELKTLLALWFLYINCFQTSHLSYVTWFSGGILEAWRPHAWVFGIYKRAELSAPTGPRAVKDKTNDGAANCRMSARRGLFLPVGDSRLSYTMWYFLHIHLVVTAKEPWLTHR